MSHEHPKVLFLCTGNSARSQMAEALLRHRAGNQFEALSGGLRPKDRVHPQALQVLEERAIDTSGLHPKNSGDFLGTVSVACAIVLCDKAQQECPRLFPFAMHSLYWPFDDPAAVEGDDRERLIRFREVRDEIDARIVQWLDNELEPT